MSSVIDQLVDFLLDAHIGSRGWLSDDWMKVFVRSSAQRLITNPDAPPEKQNHDGFGCLVIADIQVNVPGKGTGTLFLKKAHLINPWGATTIESVSNKRFADWLKRDGWNNNGEPFNWYKIKPLWQHYAKLSDLNKI